MKKNLLYLFAFVATAFMVSSCGEDDKPAVPGSSLEAKTYSTTASDLTVSLNGAPMLGKAAKFTPGTDSKASVTLTGEPLNLDAIIGGVMTADNNQPVFAFPTAGVLPGSPSATFDITLSGNDNDCAFEGNDETEFCTFAYSGKVSADNLTLSLSDVKLKNLAIAGKWNRPEFNSNFYNLFHVNWVSEKIVNTGIFPMPIGTLVSFMLVYPMLPDEEGQPSLSLADMYSEVLENVTFGEDGFITARYADTEADFTMTDAPKGVAQYVVTGENTIRVYLNPANIIAATTLLARNSRSFDISALVEDLMTNVVPMLSNGVPVHYGPATNASGEPDNTKTAFYLDTETLLPILQAVAPLFEDEDIVNAIVEMASADPSMGSMAGYLKNILPDLPEVIKTTSVVEIGINLQKAE